ncbi:allophanate hydrolase [Alcanivorax sp. JB21]|uniref:allophanate hydrolase n=1 Tax=Alcanivorax limicola TaxID=2874102 RepID=UPI001CBF3C98|nr:allophanate hydrolase [Alcanivorax limicola]MBZ2190574.1 allophanate hydrolase [Alcanivorax limicola]
MYGWMINDWLAAYRDGPATPQVLVGELVEQLRRGDPAIWIAVANDSQLARQLAQLAERLVAAGGAQEALPLYGVPFAIKDNIDVAGWQTTAACPGFAREAEQTAAGVQRLMEAGAILVGKTNLDQFATGLVGTRSPYGAVRNPFHPEFISGGSSSGSAVAVALGQVPFALGTDTAGSGRVPAGFNNLVGLKPTRGAASVRGVVPACRSLDCLSVFALDVGDAETVAGQLYGFDPEDEYARPWPDTAPRAFGAALRLGVPQSPAWFGDTEAAACFEQACDGWRALGATLVPLDFSAFHDAAALLYHGPWLAERHVAVGDLVAEGGLEGVDPIVASIIASGGQSSATDYFRAEYALAGLKRKADALMAQVDALLVPTTPSHYRLRDIEAEPVELNTRLGTYTNFVNLLDMAALALPGAIRHSGLPTGITLIAPAWSDAALLELGRRWQTAQPWPRGATGQALPPLVSSVPVTVPQGCVRLAVVGAHLSGMPLNGQLIERGAAFVERTTTAPEYRFYALAGTVPPKPGLLRDAEGAAIEVELWDVPVGAFGSFVALIPAPLGIGTLRLADGREVKGFICEGWARDDALDITSFGGWRRYMASVASATGQTAE